MATKKPEEQVTVLKTKKCKSLSSKSTLTYNIGVNAESSFFIRITNNDGGGFFSTEWIALDSIVDILKKHPKDTRLTSFVFTDLYKGKSANNPSFLAACLRNEKLLQPGRGRYKRCHEMVDPDAFMAKMKALITAKPDKKPTISKRPTSPRKR